ncbi:MAG: ABC transporter ATP-binding protein [Tannerella sp.]|jgi:zinc transport system ATP-binding protein|nr:ABC transporter ATP-binding protein [Tannerella sp.]
MEKLIEIKDVTVSYSGKQVLKNIHLDIWENDVLGIIGPNGGGKTTLLKTALGLITPQSGTVKYYKNGQQVSSLKTGYLPQINPIDRHFPISVYEVVASGFAREKPRFRDYNKTQKEQIDKYLNKMGLEQLSKCAIGELSGGQLQRVLLARAMVSNPEILVLDEPNTFIDKLFEKQLYDFLRDISESASIILVSHNTPTLLPLAYHIAYVDETLKYYEKNNLPELQ